MLLVTGSQSKNVSCFAWIWPNSDRWLVNHCAMPSIGQTWVLASIGAVVEMGMLSTLKRLIMESNDAGVDLVHKRGPGASHLKLAVNVKSFSNFKNFTLNFKDLLQIRGRGGAALASPGSAAVMIHGILSCCALHAHCMRDVTTLSRTSSCDADVFLSLGKAITILDSRRPTSTTHCFIVWSNLVEIKH
jgi:hypothetical protein